MATAVNQQTQKKSDGSQGLGAKILDGIFALIKSRFIRRRLAFYLIAGFAAITINFLLPRL